MPSTAPNPPRLSRRQHDVIAALTIERAVTAETAVPARGHFSRPAAIRLCEEGVINVIACEHQGERFWLRLGSEQATGAFVFQSILVILNKDLPNGENFFIGQIPRWDMSQKTFRMHLKSWLVELGLKNRDVISVEMTNVTDAMRANPKHVFLVSHVEDGAASKRSSKSAKEELERLLTKVISEELTAHEMALRPFSGSGFTRTDQQAIEAALKAVGKKAAKAALKFVAAKEKQPRR